MSNILKLSTVYSKLDTDDDQLKQKLWQSLRFRERGYFHSPLYRQKKWDGFVNFFTRQNGQFLTGLLPEVTLALKLLNIDYITQDFREPFGFLKQKIDDDFLWSRDHAKPVVLRDYQVDLTNKALMRKRGIIYAPTGCHSAGQHVFMVNGSLKRVEDIVVGDQLMGMDRKPRTVQQLCRGNSMMFNVISGNDIFEVNGDHLLTLMNIEQEELVDLPVNQVLEMNEFERSSYRLVKFNKFTMHVDSETVRDVVKHAETRFYYIVSNSKNDNYLVTLKVNDNDESHLTFPEFSIEPTTNKDYFGFVLDLDQRYIMDNLIVTHNSGKTFILNSLLKCTPGKSHSLVLVDRKELVHQNYEEIRKFGFSDVGVFYGEVKEPNYITVCLVNSVQKMEPYFDKIQSLFVDEVHDLMSPRCVELYKRLKNADIRIGFSATPFRYGGKDQCQKYKVKGHIGGVLETSTVEGGKLTTAILQGKDILSTSDCSFYKIDEPSRQYDIYQDAVTFGIVQNEYLNQAVTRLVSKLKGRTLLVVDRIDHGERLLKLIPGSFWIHGTAKKEVRKNTIEELKTNKGDFVAIAMDKIVNKGVNVFIHNLVNCAGGKADHQIIQRMGRGLRTSSDKEGLKYFDFFFTINPYLEKHSEERIRILEGEGHKVIVKDYFDF